LIISNYSCCCKYTFPQEERFLQKIKSPNLHEYEDLIFRELQYMFCETALSHHVEKKQYLCTEVNPVYRCLA